MHLCPWHIHVTMFRHAICSLCIFVSFGAKERCWSWHERVSWARASDSLGSRGTLHTSSSERRLSQWRGTLPQARPLACCASGYWEGVCGFSLSDAGSPIAGIQYRQEVRSFECKLSSLLQERKNYKVDLQVGQTYLWWWRIQWRHWDMEQSCSNHQPLLVHRGLLHMCNQWSTPPRWTHAVVGIFDCMSWPKFQVCCLSWYPCKNPSGNFTILEEWWKYCRNSI